MIKIGITPNFITTTGFILNLFATGLMIYAAIYDPSNTSIMGYAGGVIIFAGLFDMMDGRLARLGNMQSTFGALWDSTLDRYSELFTLFGILFYLLANQWVWSGNYHLFSHHRLYYGELCKGKRRRIRHRC